MNDEVEQVSVCICTYKRPRLLRHALHELSHQETKGRFTFSIVVADNDRMESARQVVSEFRSTSNIETTYCVEPEQNIALARNRALANAKGDFVAFLDDDEFPARDWLLTLVKACHEQGVDGVLGPVLPFFEQEPPSWLVRGKFCVRSGHKTGTVLDWPDTRTGNVVFRRRILAGMKEPFRRRFGNGGEDDDFFRRMMAEGRVFGWCNEAVVHEVVPPERWKRSYILKRALLRGQNQRHMAGFSSVVKSLIAVPVYASLLPFLLLFGQETFMNFLIRLLDHAGKLLAVLGLKPLGDKYVT
jgi:succinoglycan biosynthesis protein ExoM